MYPKASKGFICTDKTNRKWAMIWLSMGLKNEIELKKIGRSRVPPPQYKKRPVPLKFDSSRVVTYKHIKKPARFKVRGRGIEIQIARVTGTESTTYERSQPHTEGPPPSESPKQAQSAIQQPQSPTFQQSKTTAIIPTSRGCWQWYQWQWWGKR